MGEGTRSVPNEDGESSKYWHLNGSLLSAEKENAQRRSDVAGRADAASMKRSLANNKSYTSVTWRRAVHKEENQRAGACGAFLLPPTGASYTLRDRENGSGPGKLANDGKLNLCSKDEW